MITAARYALILTAVMAAPFYAAWIFGGSIADRRAQKRLTLLKGGQ